MEQYYLGYLLLINLLCLFLMWSDKRRARKGKYRIAEKTLFLTAAFGGAFGGTLGMYLFRHKTKHWYFRVGFPALLLFWVILSAVFLCYTGTSFGFL